MVSLKQVFSSDQRVLAAGTEDGVPARFELTTVLSERGGFQAQLAKDLQADIEVLLLQWVVEPAQQDHKQWEHWLQALQQFLAEEQADLPPLLEAEQTGGILRLVFGLVPDMNWAEYQQRKGAGEATEQDEQLQAGFVRAVVGADGEEEPLADPKAFAQTLVEWLKQALPEPTVDAGLDETQRGNANFEALLRRMRKGSDFPAMSAQIGRVQQVASSENESLNSLTNEILKDVALTSKLLRLVNSAQFAHMGGGISTVSRAVSLIGFSGVSNIATSLVLLEHMKNKAHAAQLKSEFLRALFAGTLATELCQTEREREELFIAAMHQNLGRLLTEFYFPDEAGQVRSLLEQGGIEEGEASRKVLGLSYDDLGLGVAKVWGFPHSMQRLMRRQEGAPPLRTPTDAAERMRWVATAANSVADTLMHSAEGDLKAQLKLVAQRFARSVGQDHVRLERFALDTRSKLTEMAEAIDLRVPENSPATKLLARRLAKSQETDQDRLASGRRASTEPQSPDSRAGQDAGAMLLSDKVADQSVTDILVTGVQDITNAMVESFRLNDVLRMIIETMYRAMGFQRVIFCLRDNSGENLVGRLGLGQDAVRLSRLFSVSPKASEDLFAAVCAKGVDTLIGDARDAHVASRLPTWYLEQVNAPSFLLLPLQNRGVTFGLIYADRAQADMSGLHEKELALLKTLRNQALIAFRQFKA